MATYRVTGPDGHTYDVTGPDGASDADVLAQVQAHAQSPAAPTGPDYTGTAQQDSNTDNLLAGVGGALSGIPIGLRQITGNERPGEVKDWKAAMAGLWSTPMGKVGEVAGAALPAIPAMMIPGVNTVAGAAGLGAVQGALQPTDTGDSRIANTALGFGLGGVGQKLGNVIGGALSNRAVSNAADLTAQKSANVVRDATLAGAQDAGYVLPPSQVNPSITNRVLEGFAGKLTTAQSAAQKNQSLTNTLIKNDIGVPDNVPLTLDSIRAARQEAAKAYAPIRSFGEVTADQPYAQALDDIATKYDLGHGGMASLRNPQVEQLLGDASKLKLDSNNALELLSNLREEGFANASPLATGASRKLGKTQLGVANAIEDLLDRNLAASGQTDALQAFREARTTIAKTFDAQKALNPSTGNIQAAKLGAMFKKDKPMSGGFATVAKAAAAFPAATKEITTSLPGISPLDYMGGAAAGAMVNPWAFATPFLRPVVRSGILSKGYQKAMVQPQSYEQGLLGKTLAGNPEELQKLLGLLGGVGAPAIARTP